MCNFSQIKDQFYYIDFPYFCRTRLKGIIEKAVQYHSGAWQKIIFVVLADKSLHVENVFECVVRLPETPYAVRRTMLYTPSKNLFYKKMSVLMSTVMSVLSRHVSSQVRVKSSVMSAVMLAVMSAVKSAVMYASGVNEPKISWLEPFEQKIFEPSRVSSQNFSSRFRVEQFSS